MEVQPQPRRLYKYRSFNVNTLRMLSEAEVYFASPSRFNDPLDCSPTIQVDLCASALEDLILEMESQAGDRYVGLQTLEGLRCLAREIGDYEEDKNAYGYYSTLLASDIHRQLQNEFSKHGVFSLGSRWDCPLMWSHYGDQHQGICIEYDIINARIKTLHPVDYGLSRRIKTSDIAAWKYRKDWSAFDTVKRSYFFAKAPRWRYEREWRIVSEQAGPANAPASVSAIYFGLRCDISVIKAVVMLYAKHDKMIRFYAIRARDQGFRLVRTSVNTDEILANSVKTSPLLAFRDITF